MAVDTAGSAEFFDTGSAPCKNEMQRMQLFVHGFLFYDRYTGAQKRTPPRGEKDKTPKMVADPEAGGYALYNISGVPAYGDARGAGIRNILDFVLMRSISCIFYMLLWTSSLPNLSP